MWIFLRKSEPVVHKCFSQIFLKFSWILQIKTCVGVIKLQAWRRATLFKKTPTKVSSCETLEICKNMFFYRTHPIASSGKYSKRSSFRRFQKTSTKASGNLFLCSLLPFHKIWDMLAFSPFLVSHFFSLPYTNLWTIGESIETKGILELNGSRQEPYMVSSLAFRINGGLRVGCMNDKRIWEIRIDRLG